MSAPDSILFANMAFYAAFSARDMAAMEKVWARDKPVTCIHPGRTVIAGRHAVLRSWQVILANPESPRVSTHAEKAHVYGDVALVTCIEELGLASGAQFLMASNVFVRTGAIWTMVHHQAGPADVDPESLAPIRKVPMN